MAETIKENRCRIARDNAGLSVGQAAKMLGLQRDSLELAEETKLREPWIDFDAMAELYGVRVEWMLGDVERYDYAAADSAHLCGVGPDGITPKDRETIAEFAASMPRDTRTFAERLEEVRKKNA